MKKCVDCGNDISEDCSKCGKKVTRENKANSDDAKSVAVQSSESNFTGGAFAHFFIGLLTGFVSAITLFLAYPAMVCMKYRWEMSHTYINGQRLKFDGKGMQLFGKFIVWLLLSVITCGIYFVVCGSVALEKWKTKHTHFESEVENEEEKSEFDGNWLQLLGVSLLTGFVGMITLGFGGYWAHCYKQKWLCKHKIIDGKRLYFDGRAWQYFGKKIVWILLTAITFGIYSFWLSVKSKKWTVSHTHCLETYKKDGSMKSPSSADKPISVEARQPKEIIKAPRPPKDDRIYRLAQKAQRLQNTVLALMIGLSATGIAFAVTAAIMRLVDRIDPFVLALISLGFLAAAILISCIVYFMSRSLKGVSVGSTVFQPVLFLSIVSFVLFVMFKLFILIRWTHMDSSEVRWNNMGIKEFLLFVVFPMIAYAVVMLIFTIRGFSVFKKLKIIFYGDKKATARSPLTKYGKYYRDKRQLFLAERKLYRDDVKAYGEYLKNKQL